MPSKFLKTSYAESIDWDAPWANEGGKAYNASPDKKIFLFFGLSNLLLTKIGYIEIFSRLSLKLNTEFFDKVSINCYLRVTIILCTYLFKFR